MDEFGMLEGILIGALPQSGNTIPLPKTSFGMKLPRNIYGDHDIELRISFGGITFL